ncbi:hypothetical protein SSX86_008059 [Deinandra increscens subsp. villosa]|uniref:Scarecrow-like protein 8 n=1 Tax=Deinandra increscens subsp. villosa TaxID=3103831 RepID=A0AAP0DEL6_9ASTR
MSSGFSGGYPDFFNCNGGFSGRSLPIMNVNNVNGSNFSVTGRSDLIGKRSLMEFQRQHQLQQRSSDYLRNVKPRVLVSPEVSSISNLPPVSQQLLPERFNSGGVNFNGVLSTDQINKFIGRKQPSTNEETERKMLTRLRELEKELLLDDDEGENDAVSVVTDTQRPETIQNLLNPVQAQKPVDMISPSPTTSSSSSCTSSSATVSPKQLISDAAEAIADGKPETAMELLTRLNQLSDARGSPEQRLAFYIASALRSRLRLNSAEEQSSSAMEIYKKEHILSTQLLYDKSPCFKLAFMAANDVILQTSLGFGSTRSKHPRHRLRYRTRASIRVLDSRDCGGASLCNKLGVLFQYNVLGFKLSEISKQGLGAANGDVLAVNFAFKLNKLPDESVTTENLRDEVLRRVKRLSPAVVTVAEQELNTNTASFPARVKEVFSYYTTFVDSFDATIPRDNPVRVKMEEGVSRRIFNSVACEGRDRVERCEVLGKWRARMRMAGFVPKPLSQCTADSLLSKVNSGTRGNPGFSVKEESGGISVGWLGRVLTTVSAWY